MPLLQKEVEEVERRREPHLAKAAASARVKGQRASGSKEAEIGRRMTMRVDMSDTMLEGQVAGEPRTETRAAVRPHRPAAIQEQKVIGNLARVGATGGKGGTAKVKGTEVKRVTPDGTPTGATEEVTGTITISQEEEIAPSMTKSHQTVARHAHRQPSS